MSGSREQAYLHKELTYEIIGAAMEVHKALGHGFLEEIYQRGMEHELRLRQISLVSQQQSLVSYKGALLGEFYLDLVVADCVALELKAVSQLIASHQSQIINYLSASKICVGLLFNFGEESLKYKRFVV